MLEKNNRRSSDGTPYDKMTDEELRQILRTDAEASEGEDTNLEQLLYIMEVLASRRQERKEEPDVKAAFWRFKRYYLSDEVPFRKPKNVMRPKTNRRKHGLVAAVAALAIAVGGLVIPDASGKSAFQHIVNWSDDFFWFESPQQSENPDGTFPSDTGERVVWKELRDLLTEHGIISVPLPNWMPEGYVLREAKVTGEGEHLGFYSSYIKGGELLYLSVDVYRPDAVDFIHKNPGVVKIYQHNGIDFYIIANMERLIITWIHEGYECLLAGSFAMTEAEMMINSMTKG